MLIPAPWGAAFGQAKPYKVGSMQPLSGTAAAGRKTALVGVQMAIDRINKMGRINGRPVELIIADYESKPDVGRRKAEKLVVEDLIDAQVGGYLSNVCLACRGPSTRSTRSSTGSAYASTPPSRRASVAATVSDPSTTRRGKRWRSHHTSSIRWARSGT